MKTYVAFLRGINVGGDTALPMARLKSLCENLGLGKVRTYIRSGNVLFETEDSESMLVEQMEHALKKSEGKHIPVIVRTLDELKSIVTNNPFPKANPSQVGVMLFVNPVPQDLLDAVTISGPEEVKISLREIYIYYPNGMGRSKFKLPKMEETGTVRNINTVTKLANLEKK